jgi:16S rRNA (guanine966-N2)-methyltransferase
MTRIVAGIWGGRRLRVPAGREVRPTAERVREAWLSILAPALPGARVLDLCAGTGALGLEALSRGAASVTFVEKHPAVLELLRENIAALGAGDRCKVVRADAAAHVSTLAAGACDVALADPPFASDLAVRLAAAWQSTPFATIFAVEHDPRTPLVGGATRRWGDIAVTFFQREDA